MADIAALQVPQIARRPLHEEAADRLRELIVHGQLGAGSRLNERLLCICRERREEHEDCGSGGQTRGHGTLQRKEVAG